jgi:hypothetical protein
MLKTGLALIGLALLVGGFAGGMYYERELVPHLSQPEPIVIPKYAPRQDAAPSTYGSSTDMGAEAAQQALREVLRETDPFLRTEHLAQELGRLGPGDVAAIPPILEDRTLDLSNPDYALLVRFWAQQDPTAAARWAATESPFSFRGTALVPAMEELAQRDPQAALGLMYDLDRFPNPYSAIAQVALVRGWYDGGGEGLEDYIYGLGVGQVRQRAMAAFARRAIMRDGPDEIMRWAASVSDDDKKFKIMVFRQVGSELAKLHPQAAAAWCDAVCEGPFGGSVRTLVAQRWAAQDGKAAMEWVKNAPPGIERDWAVQGAERGWWRERPDEFDAWLNEVTQNGTHVEPWLAPALYEYPAWIARDPERIQEALAWASRIQDKEKHWRALVATARRWYKVDPEAADAWIEQSELDEEGRAAARATGTPNPFKTDAGDPGESEGDEAQADAAGADEAADAQASGAADAPAERNGS